MKVQNIIKHFLLITKHKLYVFQYCLYAGIPLQGLLHDLSKYSPTEFMESVKYYTGTGSPINVCKEKNGYSKAWLHHKGRNPHHYEFWQDNFDKGGEALQMPFKYALEMVCDYLAAGHAYGGDNFTYKSEYDWWKEKSAKPIAMHKQTKMFIELMLSEMARTNSKDCLRYSKAKKNYKLAEKKV